MRATLCATRLLPTLRTLSLFQPETQKALFDAMAASYPRVNTLTSLGLCVLWRRACVTAARLEPGMQVGDFMAGSGELWPYLTKPLGAESEIVALDFSAVTCERARTAAVHCSTPTRVLEADALACPLDDSSLDAVVCGFGIKTLSDPQKTLFAAELARVLRPGGHLAMIEVSVPTNPLWRFWFLTYLKYVVPLAGQLLLGDPACYRMLYHYTVAFKNAHSMVAALRAAGLQVEEHTLFGGGATLLIGVR